MITVSTPSEFVEGVDPVLGPARTQPAQGRSQLAVRGVDIPHHAVELLASLAVPDRIAGQFVEGITVGEHGGVHVDLPHHLGVAGHRLVGPHEPFGCLL